MPTWNLEPAAARFAGSEVYLVGIVWYQVKFMFW